MLSSAGDGTAATATEAVDSTLLSFPEAVVALLNFIVRSILSAQTIILEASFVKLSYSNLQGRVLLI